MLKCVIIFSLEYAWAQQRLPACRPVYSGKSIFFLFSIIGLLFVALGAVFLSLNLQVHIHLSVIFILFITFITTPPSLPSLPLLPSLPPSLSLFQLQEYTASYTDCPSSFPNETEADIMNCTLPDVQYPTCSDYVANLSQYDRDQRLSMRQCPCYCQVILMNLNRTPCIFPSSPSLPPPSLSLSLSLSLFPQVAINVEEDMSPPVHVYYQMDNYYQNHRRYVNSWSPRSLTANGINDVIRERPYWMVFYFFYSLGLTAVLSIEWVLLILHIFHAVLLLILFLTVNIINYFIL